MNTIEQKCQQKGVRLTDQRKTIAKILSESKEVYGSKDRIVSFGNEPHKHNSLGKSLIIKIVDIDAILLSRLECIAVLN